MPRIIEFGEFALLVNFEQVISPSVNRHVHALDKLIRERSQNSITFTIPAYCSLTIGFNPDVTTSVELTGIIQNCIIELAGLSQKESPRQKTIEIPVCFDDEFALDRERLCQHTGLSWDQYTSEFCSRTYSVYMIGFVAGFPYLGKLPESLVCPRHDVPRKRVDKGTVAVAESQCGIYPTDSPGGWNIVGRTPLDMIKSASEDPFLFHPSDVVSFIEIPRSEFDAYGASIQQGRPVDHHSGLWTRWLSASRCAAGRMARQGSRRKRKCVGK
jgi:inhibitor of KinA